MKAVKFAASALALGALSLSAHADTETTWWTTDFEGVTWGADTYLKIDGVGQFDKESSEVEGDADGSTILASGTEWKENFTVDSSVLKLDTNGHDLKFTPEDLAEGVKRDKTLIDADVFFVGSESEPPLDDTDDAKKIQAAIFLETPEEGTSKLKVLSSDSLTGNEWIELDTGELFTDEQARDGLWLHVQISVYGDDVTYKIGERGADLSEEEGTTVQRAGMGSTDAPVSEVVFRGTGLVDNFTGRAVTVDATKYEYTATIDGSTAPSFVIEPVEWNSAESQSKSVKFSIPASDSAGTLLSRIKVLDATGAVTRNIAVEIDVENLTGKLIEGSNETQIDLAEQPTAVITVDVTSFIEAEKGGVAIKAFYGEDPDDNQGGETEYYDTGDEAAFTAALNAGFAALGEGEVPLAIDENGFTIKFVAQIAGTYKLVAVSAVDADFTRAETVAEQEAQVNDTVTLTDENAGEANAKFYKIKLVDGVKPAAAAE